MGNSKGFWKKNRNTILFYIPSLILAFTVLYLIGYDQVKKELVDFGLLNVGMVVAIYFFRDAVLAFAWMRLLESRDFYSIFTANTVGVAINAITPGAMAGEVVKGIIAAKNTDSKNVASSVFMLNIGYYVTTFFMLSLCMFLFVFIIEAKEVLQFLMVFSGTVFLFFSLFIFFGVAFISDFAKKMVKKIKYLPKHRSGKWLEEVLSTLKDDTKGERKKKFLEMIALQMVVRGADIAVQYAAWKVIFPSSGIKEALFFYSMRLVVQWMTNLIPSGWGVMEGAAYAVGELGWFPQVEAVMQQFITRLCKLIASLLYLLHYSFFKKVHKNGISEVRKID